jgi:hypothetical protein
MVSKRSSEREYDEGMKPLIVLLTLLPMGAFGADIPAGTHVLLRMVGSVSTRTAKAGDQVYLRTASPIAAGGQLLVPEGTYVQGTVLEAKRSGRVKGRAEIALHLDTLTFASGKAFKIEPHVDSVEAGQHEQKVTDNEGTIKQGSTKLQDTGRIAILAGSGAAIGGIAERSWSGAGIGAGVGGAVGIASVLLTRGKEVELNRGATLDVIFDRPLTIE